MRGQRVGLPIAGETVSVKIGDDVLRQPLSADGVPSADGLDDPLVPHWLAMAGLSHRNVEIIGSDDP